MAELHAPAPVGAVIDELADTWRSIASVARSLPPQGWAAQTDLPGWTVKDVLSHVAATESMLLGRDEPEHIAPSLDHVRNPLGEWNEQRVDLRRSWTESAVLEEFDGSTREREAVMRALTSDELQETIASPLGVMPLGQFLRVRLIDSWLHEQDVRRAVRLPETLDTRAATRVLDAVLEWLPRAVAKAGFDEGEAAVVEVTGPVPRRSAAVVRGGRGAAVEDTEAPRLIIRAGCGPFLRAATGRLAPSEAIGAGLIDVDGDAALAARLLHEVNRLP